MNIKNYIKSNPNFYYLVSFISRSLFNLTSKKINGSENSIIGKLYTIRKSKIKINGHNNIIIFNDYVNIKNCNILISGNNNTITVGANSNLNRLIIWANDNNNSVTIGDNFKNTGSVSLGVAESTDIIIGNDCLFADNIDIRTSDSHSIINKDGIRINNARSCNFGNHVWISKGVTCLKGTSIPDNCLVGAFSLVTGNSVFESNSIIAGNPAKVIKKEIDWLYECI